MGLLGVVPGLGALMVRVILMRVRAEIMKGIQPTLKMIQPVIDIFYVFGIYKRYGLLYRKNWN